MTHISYLKKDPTIETKSKALKQLEALKDNGEFINDKLYYYIKPTNFMANQKYLCQEGLHILLFHLVATLVSLNGL